MTRRFWLSLLSALPFARKPLLKAGDTLSFDIQATPSKPLLLGHLFLRDDAGKTSIWPLTDELPRFIADRRYAIVGFQHAGSTTLHYTGNRILRPADQFLVSHRASADDALIHVDFEKAAISIL